MSLEIDKQRRMAIRTATPQTRKGTPKEDEDMLVAMRRRIVEDCARRLDAEISIRKHRAALVSEDQQAIDGHVVTALEAMAGVLRREVGHDARYKQLHSDVRRAAERI
jgi:hypothetical protein